MARTGSAAPGAGVRLCSHALHLADPQLLERLNELISRGDLLNREGDVVVDPLEEGLVREDGAVLYPVREEIPIMLIGEGIPLEGLQP